ncbi:arsenosugar biosynthesis radical SAM (seleno)protein ArsS [Alkalilimnicola sp. S0819]|uniref:arsenosugar biosynthesis radical SAM (seleno)protein ArsS n=1 Tax=Alkalilimnicola sp. S0819 TaxID=2613922 RepID=UPI001262772C|nr:arsenosugar biosynthesis radical SAM (seleno)protein ArsS [Alkalilimnicola sp. S0819]KAB7627593.1 radical SAM/Cys-rich domain protein [Alkalilimnicola sp. S0819]MPQ15755.1 radical SAM/Cys-rich domain protein [Alkalilimnicola sp. S0819]
MHAVLPLLRDTDFPRLRRGALETLQMNLGYRCNQACLHCHVNAGPSRKEAMDLETMELALEVSRRRGVRTLDLTGGAPELNVHFRELVRRARKQGIHVIDRCNLTVLSEPGQEDLAEFLAEHDVEVIASMPCYSADNVDSQRGDGVFQRSIAGLRQLNALGYGVEGSGRALNLVYNPLGPTLPPGQEALQADYKRELRARFGVVFTGLFTLANMPIQRFGSTLISRGQFADYMRLLKENHKPENVPQVMCRGLVSVDYQGYLYDCDFNQMLGLPLQAVDAARPHLRDLLETDTEGRAITVADHCYGCTAGQGSSCGGALQGA